MKTKPKYNYHNLEEREEGYKELYEMLGRAKKKLDNLINES